jgi:hypothetical protein
MEPATESLNAYYARCAEYEHDLGVDRLEHRRDLIQEENDFLNSFSPSKRKAYLKDREIRRKTQLRHEQAVYDLDRDLKKYQPQPYALHHPCGQLLHSIIAHSIGLANFLPEYRKQFVPLTDENCNAWGITTATARNYCRQQTLPLTFYNIC